MQNKYKRESDITVSCVTYLFLESGITVSGGGGDINVSGVIYDFFFLRNIYIYIWDIALF